MAQNLIGKVIQKRYLVEAFIDSGAMKTVYKVKDLERGVPLALKMLHSGMEEDPVLLRSFKRDAKAIKDLGHPNIVRFYGFEQSGKLIFMLEEYIDGPSLKDVLKEQGKLSVEESLIYFKALCAALGYAHNNNTIHCDVKPGNVMIDRGGNILLTDFGIARHAGSDITSTLAGAGTSPYMAPEQILERAVTAETDIYALGIMLYEMLTGQRPFKGTENGSEQGGSTQNERIRYAHLKLQPPDPRLFNKKLTGGLADAVLKALEKEPKDRYHSTQEFFEAVCLAAEIVPADIPNRATTIKIYADPNPAPAPVPTPAPYLDGGQQTGRKTWLRYAPFMAMGLVVVAIAIIFSSMNGSPSSVPDSPGSISSQTTTLTINTDYSSGSRPVLSTVQPTTKSIPTSTALPSTPTVVAAPAGAEVAFIEAGTFLMGATTNDELMIGDEAKTLDDELPAHEVYLDAYWIDIYEVTNGKFQKFVAETGYETIAEINHKIPRIYFPSGNPIFFTNDASANWKNPDALGTGIQDILDHPVVQVTWQDADAYCSWAGGHLPTEAQWEKAARGTDGRLYPWGDKYNGNLLNGSDKNLGQDSSLFIYDDGYKYTAPVGSYPEGVSPYGVYDMAGNVMEWVQDYYESDYYSNSPRENPTGPSLGGGDQHLLRGGSWFAGPKNNRVAHRIFPETTISYPHAGFRCAYDAK
mgnify:CR=1 FL=1